MNTLKNLLKAHKLSKLSTYKVINDSTEELFKKFRIFFDANNKNKEFEEFESCKFTSMLKLTEENKFQEKVFKFLPITSFGEVIMYDFELDGKVFFKIGSFEKKVPKSRIDALTDLEIEKKNNSSAEKVSKKEKQAIREELAKRELSNAVFEKGFSVLCVFDSKKSEFNIFGSEKNGEDVFGFLRKLNSFFSVPVAPYNIGTIVKRDKDGVVSFESSTSTLMNPPSITSVLIENLSNKNLVFGDFLSGNYAKLSTGFLEGAEITHKKQDLTDRDFLKEFLSENEETNDAVIKEIEFYSKQKMSFKFNLEKYKLTNIQLTDDYITSLEMRLVDLFNLEGVEDLSPDTVNYIDLTKSSLDYIYDDITESFSDLHKYFS